MKRFTLALATLLIFTLVLTLGCGGGGDGSGKKVIVLGFDGMDYSIAREFMASGVMPNFSRLAEKGQFTPLGTSVPPLSPVAWSNFITGMDAGGHGIFDFIHRDPETTIPYQSTTRTAGAEGGGWLPETLKVGKWVIPLASGEIENLRRGTPFWEVLEERGVETTILRMPANYPPSGTASRELTGMGTPDLLGTYGNFSFYTSELFAFGGQDLTGGKVYEAWPEEGVVHATLYGPDNPFLADEKKLGIDFEVYLDAEDPVAKLVIGGEERVLEVGEWSDWVPVEFEMIPTQTLSGIARFYLRQVRPEFELYVSPLNIDPLAPALPISHPDDYAAELAELTGERFYTQGMPEDTKMVTDEVFRPEEFLAQAKIAGDEIADQYQLVLDEFLLRSGDRLLFYYFGNLDQVSHVMFRATDPEHPAYDAELDEPFADILERLYRQADAVVGETLEKLGDDTRLVIMSDHGFAPWRRAFNLNSWLRDNGYLTVKNPNLRKDPGLFLNVDWSQTRAYGAGFNGLYLNLQGRESRGIVATEEADALLAEIGQKLLETVDPDTGLAAVTKVYPAKEYFQYQGALEVGPDMLVGYARSTRASNETILGELQSEVFTDNTDAWSGDHGMDHETVPGILLTDAPLTKPATSLQNLAAAIVAEFGVEEFPPQN